MLGRGEIPQWKLHCGDTRSISNSIDSIKGYLPDAVIVVDLSALEGVHVDPKGCPARVQPGITWGDFGVVTSFE